MTGLELRAQREKLEQQLSELQRKCEHEHVEVRHTVSGGYPRPYSHCVDCGREVFDRAVPGWDV